MSAPIERLAAVDAPVQVCTNRECPFGHFHGDGDEPGTPSVLCHGCEDERWAGVLEPATATDLPVNPQALEAAA